MTTAPDISAHPCFNPHSKKKCGRVHLPVADKCNVQCNFCNRKYDCANESRPGVTSRLMDPPAAVEYLAAALAKEPRITVAGIAGPGDPFANPERTLETLRLVRERFPAILLCVASNGLNVAPYVDDLAKLQVGHMTITVNAVDPIIGRAIYDWIRQKPRIYRSTAGAGGAKVLLESQLASIRLLKAARITVKVNTVVIPGVNDDHVGDIAYEMSRLGVDVLNCMPLKPTAETPFAEVVEPNADHMAKVRRMAANFLPQMYHCTRCRSDAAGLLDEDRSAELNACPAPAATDAPTHPAQRRPRVAVASWEGLLVNQHLGEAPALRIFTHTESGYELTETRIAPPQGTGDQRWQTLAASLSDCHSVLVAGVGEKPRTALSAAGISVLEVEGLITDALETLHRNADIRPHLRRQRSGCGTAEGCSGPGTGCG
jgi:nitrogen fixation protein NifB